MKPSHAAAATLCLVLILTGCGSGNTTNVSNTAPPTGATGPLRPAGPTGPRSAQGRLHGSTPRRAAKGQRGGPGTIVHATTAPTGVIVIRGGPGTHTYGPFTRKAVNYAVTFKHTKGTHLGVASEPQAVSTTASSVVQAIDASGHTTAKIPWRRFYLWVPSAGSSYVLRLEPQR